MSVLLRQEGGGQQSVRAVCSGSGSADKLMARVSVFSANIPCEHFIYFHADVPGISNTVARCLRSCIFSNVEHYCLEGSAAPVNYLQVVLAACLNIYSVLSTFYVPQYHYGMVYYYSNSRPYPLKLLCSGQWD